MNRFLTARPLLSAALAFGALAAASGAYARSDVVLSIGVQAPVAYVQSAPVYVQPRTAYYEPQRAYVQPQAVYYRSHRGWEHGGAWGDADRDGVPNRYDRDSRFYDGRGAHRYGPWGDADHDGVPNRFDRAPHNPYRR